MNFSLKTIRRAEAEIRRTDPGLDPDDFDEAVENLLSAWAQELAEDHEIFGVPLDTPCIENGCGNCNDSGTGEGQFHGRM